MTSSFGRYQIIRPLGSGGMADVYLARDPQLDRHVALKAPRLERLSAEVLARFRLEATAVARLEDPAIVPLYEYGDHNGRPYLIMRYMPGGSLADRIEHRVASLPEAVVVIERIAAALDYAHAHGILHRDVKPGNILFDEAGEAYLSDFGIARIADAAGSHSLTKTGLVIGTVAYMSPEQALGKSLDGRADLYSLGVILYEMLTGDIPYSADSQLQQAMQHVSAPIPSILERRRDLPPATQRVIERALAKEPAGRYPTGAALAADLRGLARGQSPARAPVAAGRKPGGTPTWVWVLVVAIVGVALMAMMLTNGRGTTAADGQQTTVDGSGATEVVSTFADGDQSEGGQITESLPVVSVADDTGPEPLPTSTPAKVIATATDSPLTATRRPTATPDRGPEALTIGLTARGTPVQAVRFGSGPAVIFFIGGLHAGFAPGTVALAHQAVAHFTDHPEQIPAGVTLYVIPSASPDTPHAPGELAGRLNSNGVDANRNWDCDWTRDAQWRGQVVAGSGGPEPFSEPEVRALADFITGADAAAVIFWEARAENGLVSPGICGVVPEVSGPLAEIYGAAAGYGVDDFEGLTNQVLNGDGANWLDSQDIHAAAVLLPRYDDADWAANLDGMLAVLETYGR